MDDEFDWGHFERTRIAVTPPEWLSDDDGEEELAAGFSLLREMAQDPDSQLVELHRGVWWDPKVGGRE